MLTAGGSQEKLVSERSRPGPARSAFYAAQAASTTASWPPASTRWLSQRSRRYSHTRSTGLRRYGAGGAGEQPSAPGTADGGVPHATARRPETVPRPLPAGRHAHRRRRAEPLELARRLAGARYRAPPAQEARRERGGAARPAPALAGRGGRGGLHRHPPRDRLRGRPGQLLAGALAAGVRRRGPRHPPDERRGFPRLFQRRLLG